ncbi:MAG TPA: cytochrome c oxidase subunit 3 [Micavibrio sp.]|nr:cytochrome c oxidase subunit 3 [Micavibrio sp.]HIL29123.1 cytochrome c oxidase subunit 3 [Micavibrio sp.]
MAEEIEYGTTGKPHPYHLVRPSIWPMVGAFSAGLLAVGAVLYMHGVEFAGQAVGLKGVIIGLMAVLATMFFWWKDVLFEAVTEKAHTPIAKIGMRYGMALFIASEVMFFVAFFWAFFDASIYANDAKQFLRAEHTGGIWPPQGLETIAAFDIPFLMTMILLLSGCTVTWAHHAILEGKQEETIKALGITVFLGVFFLCFQVYEYAHSHFGFSDGIYPSTFYMATGFHGFHVFVGTLFLLVCWIRAKKGHFTKDSHFGFEAAAWYWHFVDVVWLFLFVAVYFWGNDIGVGQ